MDKLIVFNAESAFYFFRDPEFRAAVVSAKELYCDSFSLSLVLKLRKIPHKRLHGPDFMHEYLAVNRSGRVAVIGGSSVAHKVIEDRFNLKYTAFLYTIYILVFYYN